MGKTEGFFFGNNSSGPRENIPERIFLRREGKAETGEIFFVKSRKKRAEHRKKRKVLPRVI